MELRHLRYFISVAEELNFGRAALRLHIEQSPLSRAIKDLENDLGVQLFERSTRTVNLTTAGEVLLKEARSMINGAQHAREKVHAAAHSDKNPALRVAMTDGLAQQRLMQLLCQCRVCTPPLAVSLQKTTNEQLQESLLNQEADLGLSLCRDMEGEICSLPVWRDKVSLALPADHALCRQESISLEQAAAHHLIGYDEKLCPEGYRAIEFILDSQALSIQMEISASGQEEMLLKVGAGYGLGFVLSSHPEQFLSHRVVTRPVDGCEHNVITYALFLKTGAPESAMQLVKQARRIGLLD
ncbi:LysR family transcriptional regulator [Pseudomonas soli]|nr:LysR family transcriptional regulator [Pseudomonas soli]MDW9404522.1 LysR family transcriptional regulator [Pseudomonas soli]PYC41764.1 LysR family transcriptional regulator [Pseudomonas soli]